MKVPYSLRSIIDAGRQADSGHMTEEYANKMRDIVHDKIDSLLSLERHINKLLNKYEIAKDSYMARVEPT